ncbi:hypothetical protein LguiB_023147 [Lonicera macranthoides]
MPSRIAQIRLVSSHPEVYEPCDDSFLLVDAGSNELVGAPSNTMHGTNNPSEICLQMRDFSDRVVLKRSSEEESLCVIKFCRDFDE